MRSCTFTYRDPVQPPPQRGAAPKAYKNTDTSISQSAKHGSLPGKVASAFLKNPPRTPSWSLFLETFRSRILLLSNQDGLGVRKSMACLWRREECRGEDERFSSFKPTAGLCRGEARLTCTGRRLWSTIHATQPIAMVLWRRHRTRSKRLGLPHVWTASSGDTWPPPQCACLGRWTNPRFHPRYRFSGTFSLISAAGSDSSHVALSQGVSTD